MYWKDHRPAHVHAFYSGDEALVRISDGTILAGHFPKMLLVWFEIGWRCAKRNWSRTGNDADPGTLLPIEGLRLR
jgi:hypothetical protein